MKTFKQFILERDETRIPQNPGESMEDYAQRVIAAREARRARTGQDAQSRQQANWSYRDANNAETGRYSGQTATSSPPRQPGAGQTPPPSRWRGIGVNALRLGGAVLADYGLEKAIDQIPDEKTRETTRTVKNITTSALTPKFSLAWYATRPLTSGNNYSSDYELNYDDKSQLRRPYANLGGGQDELGKHGFRTWLKSIPQNNSGSRLWRYNSPDPERAVTYVDKPGGKKVKVGAAAVNNEIIPVQWGTVAGIKKVGQGSEAQRERDLAREIQTVELRKARAPGVNLDTPEFPSEPNKGSALTGLGGPAIVNRGTASKPQPSITTRGRTANLASTQLVRDPKTGQQRVGDLAYLGGKATYLARPSIASRDSNLWSRFSRWSGIGGQREADAAAAKQEYRTALRNSQTYTRQLGITPQRATALNLPGYGTKPGQRPAQTTAQRPGQRPAQTTAQRPGQRPAQTTAQRPGQRPAQTTAQRPGQRPAQTTAQRPGQRPTQRVA